MTAETVAAARSAAAFTPGDARWVFAVRVASALEAEAARLGRRPSAAVLPPERRERLLRLATQLGLRPFDASLVIAIVQDSARRGLHPLGPDSASRLEMVAKPAPRVEAWGDAVSLLLMGAVSGLLACVLLLSALRWLLGA